jgi:choline dehydrogenase
MSRFHYLFLNFSFLFTFLLSTFPLLTLSSPDYLTQTPSNTYDYIVIGSGPGGGTLASNLALSGASILLLEAGDDQGSNLDEEIAGWFFLAYNDPLMRWDFFVKYHSDENLNAQFTHLTWRTPEGGFYVGATGAPEGSELLGVYYPRAGTLGGCSTHNVRFVELL